MSTFLHSTRRALLEPAQGNTRTLLESIWKTHVLQSTAFLHWGRIAQQIQTDCCGANKDHQPGTLRPFKLSLILENNMVTGALWQVIVPWCCLEYDIIRQKPNILNRRGVQQMHECCTCICPYNLMISMTNSIFTDMWIYSHEPDLSFGSLHFELMPSMRRALLEPAQGSTRTLAESI